MANNVNQVNVNPTLLERVANLLPELQEIVREYTYDDMRTHVAPQDQDDLQCCFNCNFLFEVEGYIWNNWRWEEEVPKRNSATNEVRWNLQTFCNGDCCDEYLLNFV